MRRPCALLIAVILCRGAICGAQEGANGGRPDLLNRPVRWIDYPSDVKWVTIDRGVRPNT